MKPSRRFVRRTAIASGASAAELQAARGVALAQLKGTAPAPERPALGFELEKSNESAVQAWVEHHRLRCTSHVRGLRTLDCEDVPAGALGVPDAEGRVDSLTVAFDAEGRVVAIDALRRRMEPRAASDSMEAARERLTPRLGPPTDTLGTTDVEYLSGGPFRTAYVRYRFRDYVATVTAVHLPNDGVAVREQYLAVSTAG
jgi:hypothetical protein